jgi:hypothetical protein
MFYDDYVSSKPLLVEPGVKQFLNETLKQCREYKTTYYNLLFNVGVFLLFMFILALILIYKYKGKLSPSEKLKKDREKQQYILSKIKNFQDAKRLAHQELITGLPGWENEYDIIHRKIYI